MEAFFINSETGALISKVNWPTIQRRWVNERWDTQARILAVAGGFVVHAGHSLTAYSARFEKSADLSLEEGPRWAVTVAPEGRTIHLQRIEDDNQAVGQWLSSNTLKELQKQHEMAGITSTSDHAVVTKLAHCVQVQAIGEAPRNVYCADPSHLGIPLFLNESEILSSHRGGLGIWSTDGKQLWEREASKGSLLGDTKRSLQGNRFAQLAVGPVVFDGVNVPNKRSAVLVFDRATREQIFHLIVRDDAKSADFALPPDGGMVAILLDDSIRLFKLNQ